MDWKNFASTLTSLRLPARAEGILRRWGALVVVLAAVIYYAQYYRSGLNLGGEGGTVAVIAMRLMEGQRPITDTFLGYNVLWFYPVAWLFEITGPNYIALRLYFFAICTITGVLAFFVVRRVTGLGWYAVLAALCPILIPGMLFRNYMGFMAMLNMLTLLQAYVFEQKTARRQWAWIVAAGLALGLTYLIRIDVGAFFTAITLGLLVLYPFGARGAFLSRARTAGAALAATVGLLAVTHLPFYLDAQRRGYLDNFANQYLGWVSLVRYLASQELAKPAPAPPPPSKAPAPASAATAAKNDQAPARDINSEDYLQKRSIGDFFKGKTFYEKAFVLITYLPIAAAGLMVLPAAVTLLLALARRNFVLRTEALAVLITTGSALTLFAQYFFFRPDTPHLSEFMAPFMIALFCAGWTALRWAARWRPAWLWCVLLAAVCAVDLSLYFYHSLPKESAGTIAARRKRKFELVAENGVRVWLKGSERDELQKLCDLIKTHSRPGDYLVTYPYSPTINFMTDRPSFEYNLYVDNAHNVSSFHRETLAEFAKYHPAVVIIDNRAVNQTEDSRFSNWAAETYRWLQENYRHAGTFHRQEVYLRPDLYTP